MHNTKFSGILHHSWSQSITGYPMEILNLKIRILKPLLKTLNMDFYSDITQKVPDAKADLIRLQDVLLNLVTH